MTENLLAPYRVLDLTDEKGFLCGKILGDLGADVIKIEKPEGDPARRRGPYSMDIPDPEKSLYWFAFNTGKRSITLNTETIDGQELFRRLVKGADFVIESFVPGYLDRLGLGYSDLKKINRGIIMTSITPFGQSGPYKDYKATDLTCLAMGGLLYIVGDEDRPPVRISEEQSYCHAGAQAVAGSLIAHCYREKTGEGQHVDVSIQESVIWTLTYPLPYAYTSGIVFARAGNYQKRAGGIRHRRMYPCKDGFVCCMIGFGLVAGPMHARLVEVMHEEGLAGNLKEIDWQSLSIDSVSQEKINEIEETVAEYFIRHTKAELHELALKHDLMVVPVRDAKEILEYEQLTYRDYWVELNHPQLGVSITYPGCYFKSNRVSGSVHRRPPQIGEDNKEIYEKELGFTRSELRFLKERGVI